MKILKKYCLLLLIICCYHVPIAAANKSSGTVFSKIKKETPLKKIIKKIAKANIYDATPVVSNHKVISEQEINYQELLNTASPEELIDLATNDKNAVVRLYAFRAIMEKVKSAPQNLYLQFANDDTTIKVINGTITSKKPISTISNGFLY